MTNERRLRLNRWLLLGGRPLSFAVCMAIPTFTLYWREQGLTLGQLYLLEIIFAVALMILEILTGSFADRHGKVLAMRLGYVAQVGALSLYPMASEFATFMAAEILLAFGMALVSGTDEAFLFQSCRALRKEGEFNRWWSISSGASFVFMAIATIVGAWLASVNLSLPFIVAAGCMVVTLLLSTGMVEPPCDLGREVHVTKGSVAVAARSILMSSSSICWMAIAPAFISSVNQTFVWTYTDVLHESGLAIHQMGYVFAMFHLVAGISVVYLRRVACNTLGAQIVFWLSLGLMGSTLGLLTVTSIWACFLILPQQVIRSVTGNLFNTTVNQAIPDQVRATGLSIRNAVRVSFYVIVMTPWWLYVDSLGRQSMFVINLAVLAIGVLLLWYLRPAALTKKEGY